MCWQCAQNTWFSIVFVMRHVQWGMNCSRNSEVYEATGRNYMYILNMTGKKEGKLNDIQPVPLPRSRKGLHVPLVVQHSGNSCLSPPPCPASPLKTHPIRVCVQPSTATTTVTRVSFQNTAPREAKKVAGTKKNLRMKPQGHGKLKL